jgi:hypothetical protein
MRPATREKLLQLLRDEQTYWLTQSKMQETDRGRAFCGECRKDVTDLLIEVAKVQPRS